MFLLGKKKNFEKCFFPFDGSSPQLLFSAKESNVMF